MANLNDFSGAAEIPGNPTRKGLLLYIHEGGGNVWGGWGRLPLSPHTETDPEANTGVPLPVGQLITFMAETHPVFQQPFKLVSDGMTSLTYQELF